MSGDPAAVGECFTCRWMRSTTTRRGSTFFRCARADSDPRFARYPRLPVRGCPGYERSERDRSEETHGS